MNQLAQRNNGFRQDLVHLHREFLGFLPLALTNTWPDNKKARIEGPALGRHSHLGAGIHRRSGIMSRPQTTTRAGSADTQRRDGRTSRMAIWSLVLSILTLGGAGSIAGIWLGAVARGRISETGERGRGLATAGIVVGVITLLFAIGYWIYIARYAGGSQGHSGGGGGGGGGGY